MNFPGQAGDFFDIHGHGVDAGQQKYLQPQLALVLAAKLSQPLHEHVEFNRFVGTVDPLEGLLVPGAQGYFHHLGQRCGRPHFRQVEQGAVGQQHRRDGLVVKKFQYLAEVRMQGRLPGTGKGQVIGLAIGLQPVADFFDDRFDGDVLPAFDGFLPGAAQLAEDTIQAAGLVRDQVDSQRTSETPGGYRAEKIAVVRLFHGYWPVLG